MNYGLIYAPIALLNYSIRALVRIPGFWGVAMDRRVEFTIDCISMAALLAVS